MAYIKITRGLDIPLSGKPNEHAHSLSSASQVISLDAPSTVSLDLKPFADLKFKLLIKQDEAVKIGQPLVEDKGCPGRMFVALASGVIKEIRRGYKRSLQEIIITVSEDEPFAERPVKPLEAMSRENLIELMKEKGFFSSIRVRPFNNLANPHKAPRSIFVKAIESAPYNPPAEMQVQGYKDEFQLGLNALAKLTTGTVHLIYRAGSTCKAFIEAQNVQQHTAEGPHPIGNVSVHIQALDPIKRADDIVWVVNAQQVVALGYFLAHGRYHIERIISIAGPGVLPDRTGYFKVQTGYPIASLLAGRLQPGCQRLISGDPLTGRKVEETGFLGSEDYTCCVFPENNSREFLHFFRLGINKYSFSKGYLSGHLARFKKDYSFTTNQHGEQRAFIDSTLYDQVQPLAIPTMLLVKAVMAEDYELAESLGLLEVCGEDFALPSFVDPSKIEMGEIIDQGLKRYASEVLA
ncbi:Na(+)-translocating NADH-quinone reductase subunit A [Neochlamydia sp. TUME1]|uniref:Na(+)-translocating NADH-quinone reductase subunit A n=1 Tax=Neochlamydia sp. TUME1 TaxID=1478174 RepID=UPI00057C508B|nr:Na(+)-translocating NADH-quinone reductase subunit A [Neochlamydia sp. TUME1]KIC73258.1 Na(+)-translocating NADH-quinone reductase subunit A [Neochlamydia sp. TUME1]